MKINSVCVFNAGNLSAKPSFQKNPKILYKAYHTAANYVGKNTRKVLLTSSIVLASLGLTQTMTSCSVDDDTVFTEGVENSRAYEDKILENNFDPSKVSSVGIYADDIFPPLNGLSPQQVNTFKYVTKTGADSKETEVINEIAGRECRYYMCRDKFSDGNHIDYAMIMIKTPDGFILQNKIPSGPILSRVKYIPNSDFVQGADNTYQLYEYDFSQDPTLENCKTGNYYILPDGYEWNDAYYKPAGYVTTKKDTHEIVQKNLQDYVVSASQITENNTNVDVDTGSFVTVESWVGHYDENGQFVRDYKTTPQITVTGLWTHYIPPMTIGLNVIGE